MSPSGENTASSLWQNDTGLNTTSEDQRPIYFSKVYDSCLIVLSVLIIAINGLITVLFARKRALRTKTNTLLVSLAISDLSLGVLGIPMNIACNSFAWFPSMSGLCIMAAVVYRFIAVSTMLHIFAITIERYIVVIYPFRYMSLVRMSRLKIVMASIWGTSLFIALIQLAWQDFSHFRSADPVKIRWGTIYNIFGTVVCFVIPLCVMVFTYCRMFLVIRRQLAKIKKHNLTSDHRAVKGPKAPIVKEIRAVVIFAGMLGIFASCWSTWYLGILIEYYLPDVVYNLYDANLAFDFLRFAVSFLNPLLYTLMKLDFREALWSLFPSRCGCRQKENNYNSQYISLSTRKTNAVPSQRSRTDKDDTVKENELNENIV